MWRSIDGPEDLWPGITLKMFYGRLLFRQRRMGPTDRHRQLRIVRSDLRVGFLQLFRHGVPELKFYPSVTIYKSFGNEFRDQ